MKLVQFLRKEFNFVYLVQDFLQIHGNFCGVNLRTMSYVIFTTETTVRPGVSRHLKPVECSPARRTSLS